MFHTALSRRAVLGSVAAAAAATTLAACSKGGSGDSVDENTQVKITMLVLGDKPTNGRYQKMLEKLNPILTEKVKATLDLFYVEWADWQTQYNVQLLSGDSKIDLITTATDWLFGWENAQKGAFYAMDEDILKTNAPKTWEQVNSKGDWDLCKLPDGKIYFMPEDNYTQWTNHGYFYREDWAKEAGLADGKAQTWDDLTTYFTWVKQNQKKAFPWDVAGANETPLTGYLQGHTDGQTIQQLSAGNYYPFQTTAADPYTVGSWYAESSELIDAAKIAKQWGELGVWREDALNYDGDTREEFLSGLSGADQHHTQTYLGLITSMKERQPNAGVNMFWFGQENKNIFRDIKTHGAMAVAANSKNPSRALKVYDLLRNDEECYRLLNFGIEGTDYVITSDNKLDTPKGYDASKDSLGTNFWAGRMDEFELPRVSEPANKAEIFKELDGMAKDYPYSTLQFDKTNLDSTLAAMGSVFSQYIPQLQYGKFADPEKAITEMRDKLKQAGYEDAKKEIQAQLDKWATDNKLK
ncbi:ABC transporter substrate-binding protein [Aestuariimicrobium soli]|uniref:ABC transporter substrate-binding protein n=1 Tax=Aestuariimicrobium soli TaxID=2035834 RepID=UPI003EB77CD4